jgi:hypothetical protein
MKKATDLQHPQDVIDRHLRAALKPHARALFEAAARDKQLTDEMESCHPDLVKKECDALFERACNGDREADGILRAAGGTQRYVEDRCGFFDMARGKCRARAAADAPLWTKASTAALAALDAALVEIREQWSAALERLGEDPHPTCWEVNIGYMKRAMEKTPFNAEKLLHGTHWQVESLNLRRMLQ